MLQRLSIENYRSLRMVSIDFGQLTVVTGPNGSGKSNLYAALRLGQAAAEGRFRHALLAQGGMPSALWAGPRRKGPVRMRLALTLDDMAFDLVAGLTPTEPDSTRFVLDPEIKEEALYFGDSKRPGTQLLDRGPAAAALITVDGERVLIPALDTGESVLSQVGDPGRFPELSVLRHRLQGWRFYHHFDTGPDSPIRRPQPGVRTNVLASSGEDLAAAVKTLEERGDSTPLHEAVAFAFPGYRLHIDSPKGSGTFAVLLEAPGLNRPLTAAELSDGQLRFLCLAVALLTTRPPELLVLNEPETSLHPSAVTALAPLIVEAARHGQVWTATHDQTLRDSLAPAAQIVDLSVSDGETIATSVQ